MGRRFVESFWSIRCPRFQNTRNHSRTRLSRWATCAPGDLKTPILSPEGTFDHNHDGRFRRQHLVFYVQRRTMQFLLSLKPGLGEAIRLSLYWVVLGSHPHLVVVLSSGGVIVLVGLFVTGIGYDLLVTQINSTFGMSLDTIMFPMPPIWGDHSSLDDSFPTRDEATEFWIPLPSTITMMGGPDGNAWCFTCNGGQCSSC